VTDSRCIPIEELARVRDLPETAAERTHAESCPRCRAALLALTEFERGDDALPPESGAPAANARLDAVIETLTTPDPEPAARGPVPRRSEPGWLARLFAPPAMRFATGFAAVAIVATAVWWSGRGPADSADSGERMVRGESQATDAAGLRAVPGGWELTWTAVAGAESYDVVLLDPELREVARISGLRETRLLLSRAALPAGVTVGVPLLVEIDARSGPGVFQVSVPAAIELR
jgi:hypothetical protein